MAGSMTELLGKRLRAEVGTDGERLACKRTQARRGYVTPRPSNTPESQPPRNLDGTAEGSVPPHKLFDFMSLPTELRLHIYHIALVRKEPLFLHANRAVPLSESESDPDRTISSYPTRISISDYTDIVEPCASIPLREIPRLYYSPPTLAPRIPSCGDPVLPAILRLNKQIYKEAHQRLYSENTFILCLSSGIHTLSTLHQRSRSLIKHVILTIPSPFDILDSFVNFVRLGLRYCWGLKTFKIILLDFLPVEMRPTSATSVYANAFHILRWLPKGCSVVLEGCVSDSIRRVVMEEGRLMSELDEASYLKRQHQIPERL